MKSENVHKFSIITIGAEGGLGLPPPLRMTSRQNYPSWSGAENRDIKTHGSVSCSPRSRRVTPVSILTGRKKTQYSHLRSSVLP